jgi:small conductance mechanosensitive channel
LAADDRCHNDPATVVVVGNLGEISVDIIVRGWCASSDYSELKWGLLKTIKQRFDAKRFQYHIHNVRFI